MVVTSASGSIIVLAVRCLLATKPPHLLPKVPSYTLTAALSHNIKAKYHRTPSSERMIPKWERWGCCIYVCISEAASFTKPSGNIYNMHNLESDSGGFLDPLNGHFVSNQCADVVDPVSVPRA